MSEENKKYEKGFHPMYLWAILSVVLTYPYPVLVIKTIPKVGEEVRSSAAYEAAAKAQNGPLGADLPLVFLLVPVVIFLINLIVALCAKKVHRRVLLNCAQIIKYLLIPFYMAGGLLVIGFFIMMFTPVVIMMFLSPVIIAALCVLGYISLLCSAPLMIAYLSKSVKDGANSKPFATLMGILQFFFAADVFATIICAIKEKKQKNI